MLLGMAEAVVESGAGMVIGQTADMAELRHIVCTESCDLVITDFRVPEPGVAGGLALLQDIRIEFPGLPLMVMTGMNNPAIHHAILSMGVKALIGKSDPVDEIPKAIEHIREGVIYLSASIARAIVQSGLPLDFQVPRTAVLSRGERKIVASLARGASLADIARVFGVPVTTVFWRKQTAMRKLGVRTDNELFVYLDEMAALRAD